MHDITQFPLVSYERTRDEAYAVAQEYFETTGIRCMILNPSGRRARKHSYDKPWQVRAKKVKDGTPTSNEVVKQSGIPETDGELSS